MNPEAADRAGFSAEELGTVGVAMVEGEPRSREPVLINDRTVSAARPVPRRPPASRSKR